MESNNGGTHRCSRDDVMALFYDERGEHRAEMRAFVAGMLDAGRVRDDGRYFGDDEIADVIQDACLATLRAADSNRIEESLEGYAWTVLRFQAINRLRRARRTESLDAAAWTTDDRDELTWAELVEDLRARDAFEETPEALFERLREAFTGKQLAALLALVASDFESDVAARAIVDGTGVTCGAANDQLHRVYKKLRLRLIDGGLADAA